MTSWRELSIEQVAGNDPRAIAAGPFGSSLGRKDYVPTGVPVIRGSQLGGTAAFTHEDLVFVSDEKADRHRGNLAYPGDIVVTQRGTIGQVGRIPVDAPYPRYLLSQSQMKLTVDAAIADARFVYFALKSPRVQQRLHGATISAGVPHINLATFKELIFDAPSAPIQTRIADVLDAFEELINNNRRRISILEETARSLYDEWFIEHRFPGYESAQFVESPLGPIPEGWSTTQLGKLVKINPASIDPSSWTEVRYLDISTVRDRSVDWPHPISGEDAPGRARRLVQHGDVVHAMVRPNRRAHALILDPPAHAIASTGLAVLRPDELARAFVFETVSSQAFTEFLVGRATGAAYPAVRPIDFDQAPVVKPRAETLNSFAEFVDPLHTLAATLNHQNSVLMSSREALLPKLVTGEMDVDALGVKDTFEWPQC